MSLLKELRKFANKTKQTQFVVKIQHEESCFKLRNLGSCNCKPTFEKLDSNFQIKTQVVNKLDN